MDIHESFDTAEYLERIKEMKIYPNTFETSSHLVSLEDYFTEEQANQLNKQTFMALVYDSLNHIYNLQKVETQFVEDISVTEDGRVGYYFDRPMNNHIYWLYLIANKKVKTEKFNIKNAIEYGLHLGGGETKEFNFSGKKYRLEAKDKKITIDDREGSYEYELNLIELENNKAKNTTQLSFIPWFDDSKVEILFIGDLDNDQLPDVIIDNSYKYTGYHISGVLFLSSASGNGTLKAVSKEEWGLLRGEEMHNEGC